MKKLSIILVALVLAGAAHAQMYKWVDKDGKVRYGDVPPPGVKATPMKGMQSAPTSAAAPASKDAKKGPLSPAEQEQEYRKRQQEDKKASEKAEKEKQAEAGKNEACERSKEYLRTLQSGQRIARLNPSGERYYLDDDQVAQEIAKAQQSIQQACK
jgi:hypothetical protein